MNRGAALEWALLALLAGLLVGCASVPADHGLADVGRTVRERTGQRVAWLREDAEEAGAERTVRVMLTRPLSPEAAVQVALLKNPAVQETLGDLGLGQADLVQAGLIRNPLFFGRLRSPTAPPHEMNLEVSLAQNVMDLLLLPLRKKQAAAQFEQTKLRVTDDLLRVASDVKSAYYTLQGDQQLLALQQTLAQASSAYFERARRQRQGGDLDELEWAEAQAAYRQGELELLKAQALAENDRESLGRLLGLSAAETGWKLPPELPGPTVSEADRPSLEAAAESQRADLAAARREAGILNDSVRLARWGLISEFQPGIDNEHIPPGMNFIGPFVNVPLPLFDRQQGVLRKLRAQQWQNRQHLAALRAQALTEVHLAHNHLKLARQTVEQYWGGLIPLRKAITRQTELQRGHGKDGEDALAQARKAEVDTRREAIQALRDYWVARSELERVVGGRLPAGAAKSSRE